MQTKTKQEEAILNEIRDLPEMLQEKIFKMIHFLRSEIIENRTSDEKATAEFLSVCGTWKDSRSVEKQIEDIYSSRKSTNRSEKIF
jgi:transcriptional regulator with AAA-type ATPase domain